MKHCRICKTKISGRAKLYCKNCRNTAYKQKAKILQHKWFQKFKLTSEYKIYRKKQSESARIQRNKLRQLNPRFCRICGAILPYRAHIWCFRCKKEGTRRWQKKWIKEHHKELSKWMRKWSKEWRKKPEVKKRLYINSLRCKVKKLGFSLQEYLDIKKKGCIICGFNKLVDIHHIDGNDKNNVRSNLAFLCPNHHFMIHRLGYTLEELKNS